MKFLLPVGGIVDHRFGILTTPAHNGIAMGIRNGMVWAADNMCFTQKYDHSRYLEFLESLREYKDTCLFVSVPDVVGDAKGTIQRWYEYYGDFGDWSLAFVAQDGQEDLEFPSGFETLFIGGSTEWKLSQSAESCILRGQTLGKRIHIGRVNTWKRYKHFTGLVGSERWTCDGTRARYDGTEKVVKILAKYMESPKQLRFPIFSGDCGR